MNRLSILGLAIVGLLGFAQAEAQGTTTAPSTVTGIPLNSPWKQRLYAFAKEELKHPAWGWTHSERDYQLAVRIAEKEGISIDPDVLFAAAFTHDIGAIGQFQKDGVDHAVRSVELAEPLLREIGFPIEKIPEVSEAILGHMHDKVPGKGPASIILHDADTVDFLGSVGVARRLSVTGDAIDIAPGLARIAEFADKLPGRIVTSAGRELAVPRVAEMRRFLTELKAETADGRLP
jgi:uncharacterized protein